MRPLVILGTCSICGGRVSVPDAWLSVIAPTPTCEQCGATKANHGPVIDMTPAKPMKTWVSNKVVIEVDGRYTHRPDYVEYLSTKRS